MKNTHRLTPNPPASTEIRRQLRQSRCATRTLEVLCGLVGAAYLTGLVWHQAERIGGSSLARGVLRLPSAPPRGLPAPAALAPSTHMRQHRQAGRHLPPPLGRDDPFYKTLAEVQPEADRGSPDAAPPPQSTADSAAQPWLPASSAGPSAELLA